MIKITEKEIIDLYISGYSILKISKTFNINYKKIKNILLKNGIKIVGGRKNIIKDNDIEIINKYLNGESIRTLSKEYSLCIETIKDFLIKRGVFIENRSYRFVNKNLNENYFSKIDTEDKAYFLGLILTDGTVDDERTRIYLHKRDKYILEIFSKKIGIEKIYKDDDTFGIEIYSKKIVSDLKKYGVIKNKTYLLKRIPFENIPKKYLNHFLRGIFDGDGCISYSEKWKYKIYISEYNYSLVEQIRNVIDGIIKKENHNKIQKASCWFCFWNKKEDMIKILNYFYKDSTIYLKRKHDRYLKLIND